MIVADHESRAFTGVLKFGCPEMDTILWSTHDAMSNV